MKLWDTHLHTDFSGDCDAAPEAMIQGAKQLGLPGICFTDHLDWDHPDVPNRFVLDVENYVPKCKELAAQQMKLSENRRNVAVEQNVYLDAVSRIETARQSLSATDTFTVCTGIEIGMQPHLVERVHRLVTEYSFDFVIASSHLSHSHDLPSIPLFKEKSEDESYAEYFKSVHRNILSFDDFDVYGHIDYVVRYGPNKNKYYSYEKFADIIDEVLKSLIHKGKGIEINTSGFKYGVGHPHPTEDIIKRYRELGGEIITVGSDGHKPEHIAYAFDKVPEILKEAGFRYYTVFQERKPQFLPLE